jgi:ribonuclease P protein component
MIKKIYRLKEWQVKKVLKYWKPFFSYGVVVNIFSNNLNYNRFAVIIWSKVVPNAVSRNYFRRLFFSSSLWYIHNTEKNIWQDRVFIVKKQMKLDKNQNESITAFKKDISFLFKKI